MAHIASHSNALILTSVAPSILSMPSLLNSGKKARKALQIPSKVTFPEVNSDHSMSVRLINVVSSKRKLSRRSPHVCHRKPGDGSL